MICDLYWVLYHLTYDQLGFALGAGLFYLDTYIAVGILIEGFYNRRWHAFPIAAAPGTVISTDSSQLGWASKYVGNIIAIDHKWGYNTLYCHLKERSVENGEIVKRGQEIGFCGHTGDYSFGPQKNKPMSKSDSHLHFQVNPGNWWMNHQDPYRDIKNANSLSLWTKDNDPQYPISD